MTTQFHHHLLLLCLFQNFPLIRDCFLKYYKQMQMYRRAHEADKANPQLARAQATLRRAMFTVSLLLRHFDFNDEAVYAGLRVRNQS